MTHNKKPDYKNPEKSLETRVLDLLGRMTLEEKVRQMDMYAGSAFVDKMSPVAGGCVAEDGKLERDKLDQIIGEHGIGCIHDLYPNDAAIPNGIQKYCLEQTRLGIPVLLSEEALHGICALGSTIFPQSIAMAGTWNTELVRDIGEAIAAETRSRGIHLVFAPVLDVGRDPRWGRVEETYGEDNYLVARMGVAMVKGMHGNGLDTDCGIVAEPKHFGAHSVSQGGLNTHAVSLGKRELRQGFLAPFREAVMKGSVMSIMCAYHSNDGIPCAADKWLLTEVLRNEWGFKGFVCSDLGAVNRLYTTHHTAASPEDAIKQAVEAGLDMQFYDFEHDFFQSSLIRMVQDGVLAIQAVDRAVSSILRVKFKLGLFENPYIDPGLAAVVNRSEKHQNLALESGRQGICLLKNKDNLLPLKKDISSIAVIGPNAAQARLGDYSAVPSGFRPVTVLEGIMSAVSPKTQVTYEKGTEVISGELKTIPNSCLWTPDRSTNGLQAEYYPGSDFSGQPVLVRTDSTVNFNWIMAKPHPGIPSDEFCVRWTGYLKPAETAKGRIGTVCFDDIRLWINGKLIVDKWHNDQPAFQYQDYEFLAGEVYRLKIECRKKSGGGSIVKLGWSFDEESISEAAEIARGKDVAIVVVGDSDQTCGESKDKADLGLPGKQGELVRAVLASGTPVVMVLLNGRPMAIPWEADNVNAIVEAWYPGEKGGQAVAEILFGDYNPAGRLPITFPKYVGQVPLYYNMLHFGQRHYVDMDAMPLYPFGYGLSYTYFQYENLSVDPVEINSDQTALVEVDVVNRGDRGGHEVVQLYINDVVSSVSTPDKQLKGFRRIFLDAGMKKRICFEIDKNMLCFLGRDKNPVLEPGEFEIMMGGNSRDFIKTVLTVK